MTTKLTLDKADRVVIPKSLRDKLGLVAGDTFELKSTGEEIVLRPSRTKATLSKERGVRGYRTGTPLSARTTNSVLKALRNPSLLADHDHDL